MAQIVTITNPLTGQPTQVDQLDHTAQQIDDAVGRALPGGEIDITLANNDPRQWGLGAPSVNADGNRWDNATTNGFFIGKLNSPDAGWWFGEINTYGNPEPYCIVQKAYRQFNSASNYISFVSAERRGYSENGGAPYTWGPWEWINPPMALGVEYRTTERYLGKPVYTKLLSGVMLGQDKRLSIPHGITNLRCIFEARGNLDNMMIPFYAPVNEYSSAAYGLHIWTGSQLVLIESTGYDYSGKTVYVQIKYIKTTD